MNYKLHNVMSQSEETMKKLEDNLNRTTIIAPVDSW